MPRYSFTCEKCGHNQEKFWLISEYDNNLKSCKCEKCKSRKIYRNYQSDNMYGSVREVKTVGQLAERNTKKMGRYELENRLKEDKIPEEIEKRNKRQKLNKLAKMNDKQKTKYIMEGEL